MSTSYIAQSSVAEPPTSPLPDFGILDAKSQSTPNVAGSGTFETNVSHSVASNSRDAPIFRILQQPATSTTFYPFPKLPIELRFAIWELAIPGPRIVTLIDADPSARYGKIKAASRVPALLHVNAEVRSVALKKYTLTEHSFMGGERIYFDFSRDSLLIPDARVMGWVSDTRISRKLTSFQKKLRYLFLGNFVCTDLYKIRWFCSLQTINHAITDFDSDDSNLMATDFILRQKPTTPSGQKMPATMVTEDKLQLLVLGQRNG